MKPEIAKYFEERYSKCPIRVVPGHWPEFQSKGEVDEWIDTMVKIATVLGDPAV